MHGQWVQMLVRNFTPKKSLQIKNFKDKWGKLYTPGNQGGATLSASHFENKIIKPNESLTIAHSGNSATWGCTGNFDIYTVAMGQYQAEKVCKVDWDCPFWSDNKFEVKERNDKFKFNDIKVNREGAIGEKTIEIEEY